MLSGQFVPGGGTGGGGGGGVVGGSCSAGQATTSLSSAGVPTCSAFVTSLAGKSIPAFAWSDGFDSTLVFDGAATVTLGDSTTLAPSSNVYTLQRDIMPANMTVNAGVTIKVNGFRIIGTATGTLTNNGKISANGADAVANAGGAAAAAGSVCGGLAGANGGANAAGGAATNMSATSGIQPWTTANSTAEGGSAGNPGLIGQVRFRGGGGGGANASNVGGNGGNSTILPASVGSPDWQSIFHGTPPRNGTTLYQIATGGGGGGGNATGVGGGGGGGAGCLIVDFGTITGSGTLEAKGGNGALGTPANAGGGGGGGGGVAQITYYTRSGNVCSTAGGTKGNGTSGGTGGDGANGYPCLLYNLSGDGT